MPFFCHSAGQPDGAKPADNANWRGVDQVHVQIELQGGVTNGADPGGWHRRRSVEVAKRVRHLEAFWREQADAYRGLLLPRREPRKIILLVPTNRRLQRALVRFLPLEQCVRVRRVRRLQLRLCLMQ